MFTRSWWCLQDMCCTVYLNIKSQKSRCIQAWFIYYDIRTNHILHARITSDIRSLQRANCLSRSTFSIMHSFTNNPFLITLYIMNYSQKFVIMTEQIIPGCSVDKSLPQFIHIIFSKRKSFFVSAASSWFCSKFPGLAETMEFGMRDWKKLNLHLFSCWKIDQKLSWCTRYVFISF